MEQRWYSVKISPEVIKNKIFEVIYDAGNFVPIPDNNECCEITTSTTTYRLTGKTYVYSSMTEIVSGGTNGNSLLTGLTIPILITQSNVDIGYYSTFDGLVTQKDTLLNFIFSANTSNPNTYYFYNTSDVEFKKFLSFSSYKLDWGDGIAPIQTITSSSPNFQSYTYPASPPNTQVKYTVSMSGMSPWGNNVIKKDVYVPFTGMTIDNPNGEAFFYPSGGNWSATPISYDYIFSGDSECILPDPFYDEFTSVPFLVTGYTQSSVNDLQVYGPTKFLTGVTITGDTGLVGTFLGTLSDGSTGYTINGVNYYDFPDGTTIFVVQSSGITLDNIVCSAITKEEVLLNVIDQPEVQSDVYIERGKNSAFERIQRLGEVDNLGDLEKYGYKFFNVIKT
jgi:hypothetical protein